MHASEAGHAVVVQQKAEREARLADKKAKKEEERRKKFAKKVSLSLNSKSHLPAKKPRAMVTLSRTGFCAGATPAFMAGNAAPHLLAYMLQGGSLISANGATWQNIGVK